MNTGFVRLAVATVPTVYGIETAYMMSAVVAGINGCNSTYRLRY